MHRFLLLLTLTLLTHSGCSNGVLDGVNIGLTLEDPDSGEPEPNPSPDVESAVTCSGNPCPEAPDNSTMGCNEDDECEATCDERFVDLNDSEQDGCEYECTVNEDGREVCDGIDNDCDGQIDAEDDNFTPTQCALQEGVCAEIDRGEDCVEGMSIECPDDVYESFANDQSVVFASGTELLCDGQDNNCNGTVDENCCHGFDSNDNDPACTDDDGCPANFLCTGGRCLVRVDVEDNDGRSARVPVAAVSPDGSEMMVLFQLTDANEFAIDSRGTIMAASLNPITGEPIEGRGLSPVSGREYEEFSPAVAHDGEKFWRGWIENDEVTGHNVMVQSSGSTDSIASEDTDLSPRALTISAANGRAFAAFSSGDCGVGPTNLKRCVKLIDLTNNGEAKQIDENCRPLETESCISDTSPVALAVNDTHVFVAWINEEGRVRGRLLGLGEDPQSSEARTRYSANEAGTFNEVSAATDGSQFLFLATNDTVVFSGFVSESEDLEGQPIDTTFSYHHPRLLSVGGVFKLAVQKEAGLELHSLDSDGLILSNTERDLLRGSGDFIIASEMRGHQLAALPDVGLVSLQSLQRRDATIPPDLYFSIHNIDGDPLCFPSSE